MTNADKLRELIASLRNCCECYVCEVGRENALCSSEPAARALEMLLQPPSDEIPEWAWIAAARLKLDYNGMCDGEHVVNVRCVGLGVNEESYLTVEVDSEEALAAMQFEEPEITNLKAQLVDYKRLHEESETIAIQSTTNAVTLRAQLAAAEATIDRVRNTPFPRGYEFMINFVRKALGETGAR